MSVLVVGISHNSAPVALLERVALDDDGVQKLSATPPPASTSPRRRSSPPATGSRSTPRSTGSTAASRRSRGCSSTAPARPTEAMLPHLYVHYDDGAVSHLFQVAAGLDSMAVGEGQILGQTREALRLGQELGTVGPALNALFQQALRVGKRTRAETGIDQVAPSLVTAALDRCDGAVGAVARQGRRRGRRRRDGRPRRPPPSRRLGAAPDQRRQPHRRPRRPARRRSTAPRRSR